MVELIITVMLAASGDYGAYPGIVYRIEYPTQYACEAAAGQVNIPMVAARANAWYTSLHAYDMKKPQLGHVFVECEHKLIVEPGHNCNDTWRSTCSGAINRIRMIGLQLSNRMGMYSL